MDEASASTPVVEETSEKPGILKSAVQSAAIAAAVVEGTIVETITETFSTSKQLRAHSDSLTDSPPASVSSPKSVEKVVEPKLAAEGLDAEQAAFDKEKPAVQVTPEKATASPAKLRPQLFLDTLDAAPEDDVRRDVHEEVETEKEEEAVQQGGEVQEVEHVEGDEEEEEDPETVAWKRRMEAYGLAVLASYVPVYNYFMLQGPARSLFSSLSFVSVFGLLWLVYIKAREGGLMAAFEREWPEVAGGKEEVLAEGVGEEEGDDGTEDTAVVSHGDGDEEASSTSAVMVDNPDQMAEPVAAAESSKADAGVFAGEGEEKVPEYDDRTLFQPLQMQKAAAGGGGGNPGTSRNVIPASKQLLHPMEGPADEPRAISTTPKGVALPLWSESRPRATSVDGADAKGSNSKFKKVMRMNWPFGHKKKT